MAVHMNHSFALRHGSTSQPTLLGRRGFDNSTFTLTASSTIWPIRHAGLPRGGRASCSSSPPPCTSSTRPTSSPESTTGIPRPTSPPSQTPPTTVSRWLPSVDMSTLARSPSANVTSTLTMVALLASAALLLPGAGHCTEALSDSALSKFQEFLDYVDHLGPAGIVVFVASVMVFEMIPLFPTQPLSLAGGLLFGPVEGTLAVLLGMTLAALNAFLISRGVGKQLAQKVIEFEMGNEGSGAGPSPVAAKLAEVQATIKSGGFFQQLTAIMLLRLTPVVPFSASNYLLGLSPVKLPAYLAGTVVGMSVWALLYATLGAASRQLLDGGEDMATLFSDLMAETSKYSSVAIGVTVALGCGAGGAYLLFRNVVQPQQLEAAAKAARESESESESERESEIRRKILQESK